MLIFIDNIFKFYNKNTCALGKKYALYIMLVTVRRWVMVSVSGLLLVCYGYKMWSQRGLLETTFGIGSEPVF